MHQYLNQSISWGTHRLQDLSPAFSQLVKNIGYEPAAQIPADALANPECSWWDTHDAVEVNVALFDQLNELAPGGWYFGSHPTDGADYGFWPEEDDE
jgi:hypothetical protein